MTQTLTVRPARPAPLPPLAHRQTRITLLLHTYLDAIDETDRNNGDRIGKPASRILTHDNLWRQGSYQELDRALDELRQRSFGNARGIYDCVWSVYIIRSTRHLKRREPKARIGLHWLAEHMAEPVYVPAEVSMNAGYDQPIAFGYAIKQDRERIRQAA